MRLAVQHELIHRFRSFQDERTTQLAPSPKRVPTQEYVSPARLAAERAVLFRGGPVVACLSADVPDPGSHLATEVDGVPVLVTRGDDGTVRAFFNACRHRGAPVASGRGQGNKVLTCPYHAWSYRLDGALHRQPRADGYFDVGESLDLRPASAGESAGLVFVRLDDEPLDPAGWLGDAADDLDAYGIANWHHAETRTQTVPLNWKLVIDSFLEGYHIFRLHKDSIARSFYSLPNLFDGLDQHLRFIGVWRTIDDIGDDPAGWSLLPHATIHHAIFPNTLVVHQLDHLEVWRVFPHGDDPGTSWVETSAYAPDPIDDRARARWAKNLDILLRVTGTEDFPLLEASHRSMTVGACPELIFGRNEPALIHFHEQVDQALTRAATTAAVTV